MGAGPSDRPLSVCQRPENVDRFSCLWKTNQTNFDCEETPSDSAAAMKLQ